MVCLCVLCDVHVYAAKLHRCSEDWRLAYSSPVEGVDSEDMYRAITAHVVCERVLRCP